MGENTDLFESDSDVTDDEGASVESDEFRAESDSDNEFDSFDTYMESLEEELKNSKVGSSLPEGAESEQVKIDKNLIQNLIDSFSAQDGLPGPVSNIMLSLNTPLPKKQ